MKNLNNSVSTSRIRLFGVAAILISAGMSGFGINAQDDSSSLLSLATSTSGATQATNETFDSVSEDLVDPAVSEAVDFTRELTDRANFAFTSTSDESAQLHNFQDVLSEGLALDFLGRFMLGSHRNSLTDDQQSRYSSIFPDYITRLYAEQFRDIAGRDLDIINATPFKRGDVIVRTQFLRDSGQAVNVDWRTRKLRNGNHRMIDIVVSGVSIMTVKREEFSSFISNNSVDALITRLEENGST